MLMGKGSLKFNLILKIISFFWERKRKHVLLGKKKETFLNTFAAKSIGKCKNVCFERLKDLIWRPGVEMTFSLKMFF